MNNEFLIKISHVINELESEGFYKEADELHKEFIKIADEIDVEGSPKKDLSKATPGAIGVTKSILKKPKPVKNIQLSPRALGRNLKLGLLGAFLDYGIDWLQNSFEDAQGPYLLFKNHLPDVKLTVDKINSLVSNPELKTKTNDLVSYLDQLMNELEKLKSTIKTANSNPSKTIYNNSDLNQKLAIRGDISDAPKYLRELIKGGLIGGGLGAFAGGVGAIPGAIAGAAFGLGGKALEDIWYGSISDTGKAYLQAKDLEEICTRLANSYSEIDPNITYTINEKADQILNIIEKLNLKNPNKSYLENVIRHFEKKVERTVNPVIQKVEEVGEKARTLRTPGFDNNSMDGFAGYKPQVDVLEAPSRGDILTAPQR